MSKESDYSHTEALLDISYLLEIGNNNKAFVKKMLTHFKGDIPKLLTELSSALEIQDAVEVKERAHKAKSVAGYLNDKYLHSLLAEIEENGASNTVTPKTRSNYNLAKIRFTDILLKINAYLEKTSL